MASKKIALKKLVGTLCLINLVSFLTYYLTTYVFAGTVSVYVFYFYTEIVRIIIPIASAVAIFVTYAKESAGKCFLHSLYCTLPWLISLFPFYAYEYAYQGLVIETVISFAALHTLFMVAVLYLENLILGLIMIAASRFLLSIKKVPYTKSAILCGNDPLDFSTPSSVGLFAGCSLLFLYNLIREIVDTVQFIGYADGIYEPFEIIYIVIKYVFILGTLLASYFAAHKLERSLKFK